MGYRARNQTDRQLYAVKKTTQISQGNREEKLREVFALASVSVESAACPNIVRYFSSWLEDGHLHIQTELCECSLRDCLGERRWKEPTDPRFSGAEVSQVLQHVANGLAILHSNGFVHLDIKPDNILINRGEYKIADLGLAVAAMRSACDDICEGDCRYLAKEVLRGDLSNLPKADVFALGLVCYELAINPKALPCNGEEWHRLRDGCLDAKLFPSHSEQLLSILHSMVHPVPKERPACESIQIQQHDNDLSEDGVPAWLVEQRMRCAAEARAEALQEEMRQRTLEAERNKKLADAYWQELMSMKAKELLAAEPPQKLQVSGALAGATGTIPATSLACVPPPRLARYKTL